MSAEADRLCDWLPAGRRAKKARGVDPVRVGRPESLRAEGVSLFQSRTRAWQSGGVGGEREGERENKNERENSSSATTVFC